MGAFSFFGRHVIDFGFSLSELKNECEDAKDEARKLENAVEQKEKECTKELSKAIQIEKDKIHVLLKEKCVLDSFETDQT